MDGQKLVMQTLDQIPQANSNAKRIVGLVKEGGRITGYQRSDNFIVEKQQAVAMAKQGQIAGVGIAHCGDTEHLKSIPDGSENNNLSNLPSVSPESRTSYFDCQRFRQRWQSFFASIDAPVYAKRYAKQSFRD